MIWKVSKTDCRGEVGESLSVSINALGILNHVAANITVAIVVVIVDCQRQHLNRQEMSIAQFNTSPEFLKAFDLDQRVTLW